MSNQDLKNDAQRLLNNLQWAKTEALSTMPATKSPARADAWDRQLKLTGAIAGVEAALVALSDCPEAPAEKGVARADF